MVDPPGITSPKKTDSPSTQPPPVPWPDAKPRPTLPAPCREPAWPEPLQILRLRSQLLPAHPCNCPALSRKPCAPRAPHPVIYHFPIPQPPCPSRRRSLSPGGGTGRTQSTQGPAPHQPGVHCEEKSLQRGRERDIHHWVQQCATRNYFGAMSTQENNSFGHLILLKILY